MGRQFLFEDRTHAEYGGEFSTLEAALAEVQRLAQIAWDQEPNIAPCSSWEHCGREWVLTEYEDAEVPWVEVRRIGILWVSSARTVWQEGDGPDSQIPPMGPVG